MRINQNVMAFNAYRNLSTTQGQMGKSLEKLSSGFRINRAADDAAGLSISEQLRSEVRGLHQAARNAQDGVSVVQTAEGALTEVHEMLQRMRELAVQASNTGSNDQVAREAIQAEIDELASEVDRIAETTSFAGVNLLDGTYGGGGGGGGTAAAHTFAAADQTALDYSGAGGSDSAPLTFDVAVDGGAVQSVSLDQAYADLDAMVADLNSQTTGLTWTNDAGAIAVESDTTGGASQVEITNVVDGGGGANIVAINETGTAGAGGAGGGVFQVGANSGDTITLSIAETSATSLGIDALDVVSDASGAIDALGGAVAEVSEQRSVLGATQNRLEHTIANLEVTTENLQASESRIRDTDMAQEMVSFTRHQILQQAGTAMLAQANQVPQSVLGLL